MKITEYLKQTNLREAGELCSDVSDLLARSLSSGYFPSPVPPPRDLNAVTGTHADILNGQRIELAAFAAGHARALWINAPDAAFLGLEPEAPPLPLVFRVNGRIDAEYVYLLDSFSEQSRSRMYAFAASDAGECQNGLSGELLATRGGLSERVLHSVVHYDTGLPERGGRYVAARHYRLNSMSGSQELNSAREIHRSCLGAVSPPAKPAFDYIRAYHAQQLTGLPLTPPDADRDRELKNALEFLSGNPREAVKTFFFARLFASRLCRRSLSLSPGESAAPAAARTVPAQRARSIEEFIGR
jgi:hypothetical protein